MNADEYKTLDDYNVSRVALLLAGGLPNVAVSRVVGFMHSWEKICPNTPELSRPERDTPGAPQAGPTQRALFPLAAVPTPITVRRSCSLSKAGGFLQEAD